jgi:LysR family glycine cleavage system transcriptional activator
MRTPRRFLPSLPLLCAFEAAARTGSVTAAGQELSLTQGAVSRQIRALEAQLEVELFHRERQKIRLTAAGEIYVREIRDALRKISAASLSLRASPFGGTLALAVPPSFGARWLAGRLPAFHARHPELRLHLFTRPGMFDFRLEAIDAAIHFCAPDWQGAELLRLCGEVLVPVCAPAMKAEYGFGAPADLLRAPLLHLATRPDAWERWFEANGVEAGTIHGMLFDQFLTAAEAAAAGLGLALLPEFLFAEEMANGRLLRAVEQRTPSVGAYHLAWPSGRGDYPPLRAFRAWLLEEMAERD